MIIKSVVTYFFILYCWCPALAQKSPLWEVSAAATQFNFTGIGQRSGFGVTAEYYLNKKISVKGSVLAGKDYLHLSLAPLFWQYALYWINEKPDPKDGYSHRLSGNEKYRPLVFLAGLLFSDGITYNMPLQKDLYFCPYVAPMQLQLCLPETPDNKRGGVLSSSLGAGLKAYHKNLVFYAGAEYSRSFILKPRKGFGYSINASVGYVVVWKKKRKR